MAGNVPIVDLQVEARVLKTLITQTNSETCLDYFNKVRLDLFGHQPFANTFLYLRLLMENYKSLPSEISLQQDPQIPPDIGGYLWSPQTYPATSPSDFEHMLLLLEQRRKIRHTYGICNNIMQRFESEGHNLDFGQLEPWLEEQVQSLHSQGTEDEMLHLGWQGNASPNLVQDITTNIAQSTYTIGFRDFDNLNGGISPGNLVLVVGNTKGGKSFMAMQILCWLYLHHNLSVCLVSLELSKEQILRRLFSYLSEIDSSDIRKCVLSTGQAQLIQNKWNDFLQHGIQNKCQFSIMCPKGEVTVTDCLFRLRGRHYAAAAIDYVSLLKKESESEADWMHLKQSSMKFKRFCASENFIGILPCQLDEETEAIRYSRALKENCDLMFSWFYGEQQKKKGKVEIKVTSRDFNNAPFFLVPTFAFSKFRDYDESNANPATQEQNKARQQIDSSRLDFDKPSTSIGALAVPPQPGNCGSTAFPSGTPVTIISSLPPSVPNTTVPNVAVNNIPNNH